MIKGVRLNEIFEAQIMELLEEIRKLVNEMPREWWAEENKLKREEIEQRMKGLIGKCKQESVG